MVKPLLIRDVADIYGVSVSRIVALDDVLSPARTPRNVRVYSADRVDFVAGQRLARRAA